MQLPAHYTVLQVTEALLEQSDRLEKEIEETKENLEKASKPYYVKHWFGIYTEHTKDDWGYKFDLRYLRSELQALESKIKALQKLPKTAKVKLSVEEINTLFGA